MNRNRVIFYSILGAYQLVTFLFTLMMENDTGFLFQLVGYVKWFKFGTFFGLTLVVIDFIWWWRESKMQVKNAEALRHENNTLKARVYDLQEAAKEQAKNISSAK